MVFNILIVAVYIVAVVLADVPSAVLFAGLDTFKAMQPKFRVLETVPSLVTFCVIICFQPLIQLFLRVTPAQNFLGFGLSWVNNPAARDPQLWGAVAMMLLGLILTTVVLQKYSA
jgi:hypothetical protein